MNDFIKVVRGIVPEANEEFKGAFNIEKTRKRVKDYFKREVKRGVLCLLDYELTDVRCDEILNSPDVVDQNKCLVKINYKNKRGADMFCLVTLYQQPMIEWEDEEGWYNQTVLIA